MLQMTNIVIGGQVHVNFYDNGTRLIAVNNILFQTDFKGRKTGFIQSLE